ncbi:hypothetical protein [Aeromonas phage phiWae14]|nr:hypothetical protein [Aeromonas phage phiWae14]
MNIIGTKINHLEILSLDHVDCYGNKVYACSCSECATKTWLGTPVLKAYLNQIPKLRCWCDRRFKFDAKQREILAMRSIVNHGYSLHLAPVKEEWHRQSEAVLICPNGHQTFNKIGELMLGKPKCDVCIGIEKKKPKHLAVKITSDYAKRHGYTIRQVSGWAGESTQYQVTCKSHGSFDLSLRRIKSNTICESCATYKSPEGLC